MAAIQKMAGGRIAPVIPPGMDVSDRGYAEEDLKAGDLIVISPDAPPSEIYEFAVKKATGTEAHGICLVDCNEGGLAEISTQNEMEGYTGLTPGAGLTVIDGELDDDLSFTVGTDEQPAIVARCVTTSRIRVLFV